MENEIIIDSALVLDNLKYWTGRLFDAGETVFSAFSHMMHDDFAHVRRDYCLVARTITDEMIYQCIDMPNRQPDYYRNRQFAIIRAYLTEIAG